MLIFECKFCEDKLKKKKRGEKNFKFKNEVFKYIKREDA